MTSNPLVTFYRAPMQWLAPVQLTGAALARLSVQPGIVESVVATLRSLASDDYQDFMIAYLEKGLRRFGVSWGYTDLLTVLQAGTQVLRPENYLEIGVRRGRSLGIVAAAWPEANLFGFDLWTSNYAGMENPGPDFVRSEMRRLKHKGQLTLVSGDSKETVPAFFTAHPDLAFDLITVDGDHSAAGARIDLQNVLPRLKIGGVIVLDDIAHPQHTYLQQVWDHTVATDRRFSSASYTELGYGVAFAVRHAA